MTVCAQDVGDTFGWTSAVSRPSVGRRCFGRRSWMYSNWPSTATGPSARCSAGHRSGRSPPGTAPRVRLCTPGAGGSCWRVCQACWTDPGARNSPAGLSAEMEAEICELRRRHLRWGARRIAHELSVRGLESARRGPRSTGCCPATAWSAPRNSSIRASTAGGSARRPCTCADGPGRRCAAGRRTGMQDGHRHR